MTNVIYTKISLNFFQLLAHKEFCLKGNLQYDYLELFFIGAIVILIIAAHICSKLP